MVNCAGAWCTEIARTAGVHLPVEPVKRQIFALDTKVKPDGPLPLTYFYLPDVFQNRNRWADSFWQIPASNPVGISFSWDEKRFYDLLWAELAEFVPEFEELKLVRGWAGLYAMNTLDENAILGMAGTRGVVSGQWLFRTWAATGSGSWAVYRRVDYSTGPRHGSLHVQPGTHTGEPAFTRDWNLLINY